MKKSITTTLTRDEALALARKNSEQELATIDQEVQAHIARELAAAAKRKAARVEYTTVDSATLARVLAAPAVISDRNRATKPVSPRAFSLMR